MTILLTKPGCWAGNLNMPLLTVRYLEHLLTKRHSLSAHCWVWWCLQWQFWASLILDLPGRPDVLVRWSASISIEHLCSARLFGGEGRGLLWLRDIPPAQQTKFQGARLSLIHLPSNTSRLANNTSSIVMAPYHYVDLGTLFWPSSVASGLPSENHVGARRWRAVRHVYLTIFSCSFSLLNFKLLFTSLYHHVIC